MGSSSDSDELFHEVTEVEDLVADATNRSDPPSADSLSTNALEHARTESENVIERQLTLADHIDDLAMRNARTAVIVISILASAAGIADSDTIGSLPQGVVWFAGAGVVLLASCVFAGLGTVFATDRQFGMGGTYRDEVREQKYSENEWLLVLLDGYDEWTNEMNTELAIGRRYLQRGQFLLFSGVLSLLLAMLALLVA